MPCSLQYVGCYDDVQGGGGRCSSRGITCIRNHGASEIEDLYFHFIFPLTSYFSRSLPPFPVRREPLWGPLPPARRQQTGGDEPGHGGFDARAAPAPGGGKALPAKEGEQKKQRRESTNGTGEAKKSKHALGAEERAMPLPFLSSLV